MKVIDDLGIEHDSQDILAADRLLKMKRDLAGTEANGLWQVIAEVVKVWQDKNPEQWDSYLIELKDIKSTRKDEKFGLSWDKTTGKKGNLRYTLDIPAKVYAMIRSIYDSDELPMDRVFFLEFAKQFPMFKVAAKL